MTEYENEIREVLDRVSETVRDTMTAPDNVQKYPPYSYKRKAASEHLKRAIRHIITYQLEASGCDKPSGEPHLYHALTRICMAVSIEKEGQ